MENPENIVRQLSLMAKVPEKTIHRISELIVHSASFGLPKATIEEDYLLSRHLFINTYGIFNHYVNQLISRHNPSPNWSLEPKYKQLLAEANDSLIKDGYFVFRMDNIPISEYLDITELLDQKMNIEHIGARAFVTDIKDLLSFNLVKRITSEGVIWAIADKYLRCKSLLNMCLAWKTYPTEKRSHLTLSENAMSFHFDADNNRFLKLFVYLTDVGLENGPHVGIKRTHARYRSFLCPSLNRDGKLTNREILNSGLLPTIFTGKRGTFILADTHCLHKGSPVWHGKTRYILQLQFADSPFGALPQYDIRYSSTLRDIVSTK